MSSLVPNVLWDAIESLLPEESPKTNGGHARPRPRRAPSCPRWPKRSKDHAGANSEFCNTVFAKLPPLAQRNRRSSAAGRAVAFRTHDAHGLHGQFEILPADETVMQRPKPPLR